VALITQCGYGQFQGSSLYSPPQRICPRRHPLPNDITYTFTLRKPKTGQLDTNNRLLYWKTPTNVAMLWFKKREGDIEMEPVRGQKKNTAPEDTEYRPINWKKILLSPKYIRMLRTWFYSFSRTDQRCSMAHSQYSHSGRNSYDNNKTR
jgi:hypothetical protein